MRLKQIEAFHAVMLTGSVSGAARLLHVTQPAITQTLQHAELQLGYALFTREGRRLTPTHEARQLFPEVQALMLLIRVQGLALQRFLLQLLQMQELMQAQPQMQQQKLPQ